MTDPGVAVVPRRVGPATRGLVAVLIGLPPGSLFVALFYMATSGSVPQPADAGDTVLTWAWAAATAGFGLALLTALNYGFVPRMRGSVLEVWTLLGRQTVDLAALVAVGYQKWGRGSLLTRRWYRPGEGLRLSDPVNTLTIVPPGAGRPDVRNAVRRAVWEAAGRGINVPPPVARLLGLPPLPGMQDDNLWVANNLLSMALMMAGICAWVGIGMLAVLLAGQL